MRLNCFCTMSSLHRSIRSNKNVVALMGRGAGKTARAGRTIRHIFQNDLLDPLCFIARTPLDFVRNILPGLVAQFPFPERPSIEPGGDFNRNEGILHFPYYQRDLLIYSGANPDSIRGVNLAGGILDEWANYDYPEATFSNFLLANQGWYTPLVVHHDYYQ